MSKITYKIISRSGAVGKGKKVFARSDFDDLGSPASVTRALRRLVAEGKLRKVGRGLYDFPRRNKYLKGYPPVDPDQVVKALENRDGVRIMPNGFAMANQLGLTTAVPSSLTYLTDGSTRQVSLGRRKINLKRAGTRWMRWYDKPGREVVLALRWLGKDNVDRSVVGRLRSVLPPDVKESLVGNSKHLPLWMRKVVNEVAHVS